MKEINCDVIRDLLINYNDKTSSEATNKLVEEHLKYCPDCTKALEDMNKEIDTEPLQNQEKEIDYLKGYKKKKVINIIFAVVLTACVLLAAFIGYVVFMEATEFYLDVNDVNLETRELELNSKSKMLIVTMSSDKWHFANRGTTNYHGSEDVIYLDFVGKGIAEKFDTGMTMNEKTQKIYLRDKKGNLREIWNREYGKDYSNIFFKQK